MIIRKATIHDVDAIYSLGSHVPEFLVNNKTASFWPKDLLHSAVQADDVLITDLFKS